MLDVMIVLVVFMAEWQILNLRLEPRPIEFVIFC